MQCSLTNSRVSEPESRLRVLYNINTYEPIENFPLSLAAVQTIGMFLYHFCFVYNSHLYRQIKAHKQRFRELLEALGINSPANEHWQIEDTRQEFRIAIACQAI